MNSVLLVCKKKIGKEICSQLLVKLVEEPNILEWREGDNGW
jgi:hypothetical protein